MRNGPALTDEEWQLWHVWMEAQRVLAGEVDRSLQAEAGISKAEFSVLVTLRAASDSELRVGDLAATLRWEKSRVAHLLTRMERRGLIDRTEAGAARRRTAIGLSPKGREAVESALRVHARSVRRAFFDRVTAEQAAAIRDWSEQMMQSTAPADRSASAE
jgi:DNA-binding MarR family transcriptional regulator